MPASSVSLRKHSWLMPVLVFALALITLFNMAQARVITAQHDLISVLERDSFAYYSMIAHQRQKSAPVAPVPDAPKSTSSKN